MAHQTLQQCFNVVPGKITCLQTRKEIITGEVFIVQRHGQSSCWISASVQLYSSTRLDPNTGKGKLSEKAYLKHGKSCEHNGTKITKYKVKFRVEPDFGIPGAFLIKNEHKHKFFLQSATLEVPANQSIQFNCKSWIYPFTKTKTNRLFFSNTVYLPNETPEALDELRKEELESLRGHGTGERKEWDRVYEYDYYNDLGNPDKGQEHVRPILGGSDSYPYPRRGRTGRPCCNQDPLTESRPTKFNLDIYVPPDERFSPKKLSEFIENSVQAIVHFPLPEAQSIDEQESNSFESLEEIKDIFSRHKRQGVEGWIAEELKSLVSDDLFKEIKEASKKDPMKFPLPKIIEENELAWKDDEEFARQMLSGVNPTVIKGLEVFPPQSRNGVWSSIKASHIQHNLDGLTIAEAMNQWRILILDHHDYLLPFLNRINTKGICVYASRTLLFLRDDHTLKLLAIELSLPGSSADMEINRVFLPTTQGTEAALWLLAKAHVAVNDSAYHQLISHWLNTHAVVEPFIIATRRQLSVMHPVHRLLDPHFKDTMHINALSRSIIINSGGILEKILFTQEISMELSSAIYRDWRFDEQGLPADLIKRGLALKDPDNPTGVYPLLEDYPYGADGLEIWTAIKTWVTDFCSLFYTDDDSVRSDVEIQAWWSEIKNVGHGDKCNERWWYPLTTLMDLIEALTTLIWIASALHASVNFGQYAYAGYPPNRPTLCRQFIPNEGTHEFAAFLKDPDGYYLKMLPARFEMTIGVALIEVLSQHASDEVYIGQKPSPEWTDNEEVRQRFEKFRENLQKVERKILVRNRDPKLKNRKGPAKIPYKLLYPDTSNIGIGRGITGKGIPNSISI
ncbi:linoleate 9S-lipoxygenase 6 [Vitis vinifera]|uniref:linoleate 9S-lipoxygenase 6 n=1 Tax=Vitis vinifera TaxID=29760 RepID=UPI0028833049|nr:linoleate 9S-lipoxygenase 6 [Vitis vinifera]